MNGSHSFTIQEFIAKFIHFDFSCGYGIVNGKETTVHIRTIWENPLWLLFSSLVLFSLVVIVFLFFRSSLLPRSLSLQQNKTPSPTPTPVVLSIAIPTLQKRTYPSVPFHVVQTISSGGNFTSSVISYTVDGLNEYALLDIPNSPRPAKGFPVVLLDHGYIVPSEYNTVSSYASVADFFASNGYIVLKPDYRGNGNSQGANDSLQRYNYPVDVMTLLSSVKQIPQADSSRIYLWGHSMGGEVTLEVLEILGEQPALGRNIKAAVLWAPVTDPGQWFTYRNLKKLPEAQLTPFPYSKTFQILGQPSDSSPVWQSINPLRFLSSITVPLQINHGTADPTVPYSWSLDLRDKLQATGKQVTFVSYPDADHNLMPDTMQALKNSLQFFQNY